MELLNGNAKHIQSELGVNKHVFLKLIEELRLMGYSDGRNVTLEEKLAIFLYACVTGLTVRHLGGGSKGQMVPSQSAFFFLFF